MKQCAVALLVGLLFGWGLSLSGMTDPTRVIGFLDVAGHWDPSLLFVMGGALMVTGVLFRFVLRRSSPFFASEFQLPVNHMLSPRLLCGSGLFGVGWGLSGYCPGPALTSLGFGFLNSVIVVCSMLAGFFAHKVIFEQRA